VANFNRYTKYTVVCSSLGTQVQKWKGKSSTTPQALQKPWCGLLYSLPKYKLMFQVGWNSQYTLSTPHRDHELIHVQKLSIKWFTFERLCCSSISLKMVLPAARGARGTPPSVLSSDDLVLARNGFPVALVLTPEKVTERVKSELNWPDWSKPGRRAREERQKCECVWVSEYVSTQ
jgi:hypothetical protein